ncbi:MAG: DASS family sodium-coupled anion symporter [Acidobacteria bacterium]|nr:DASS family sodium-coupled anion symporter [Acidobacteriota bacterium]
MKPEVRSRVVAAAAPIAVGLVVLALPVPAGLTPGAWRYFALFAAVVAGLMAEPLPAAAIGFIGVGLAALSRLVVADPADSLKFALSGFSNGTVWLVFAAFMIAQGYEKTGLGRRLALLLVRRLGGRTIGLGYAVALADLVIGPFMPSNTARSAGTIFPIARNIPALYGSEPGPTARRIGGYVMWTAFAATAVTCSVFATALAPNLLAIELVARTTGIHLSIGEWFLGAWPVGLVLMATLPLLVYVIYPPEVKSSPEVPIWANRELEKIGPVSRDEWLMAALAIVAVIVWTLAADYVDPSTTALLVVSVMLMTGLISWQDIVSNWRAWNVFMLLATLVALSDGLARVGFIPWFAKGIAGYLGQFSPAVATIGLVVAFFLSHYMFASLTAHTVAVLPVVLAAGAAVPGVPVRTLALLLCYSLGLMGVITPYATGPAPVYYGSGFLPRLDFWRLGFIFGMWFLAVLLLVGYPLL